MNNKCITFITLNESNLLLINIFEYLLTAWSTKIQENAEFSLILEVMWKKKKVNDQLQSEDLANLSNYSLLKSILKTKHSLHNKDFK